MSGLLRLPLAVASWGARRLLDLAFGSAEPFDYVSATARAMEPDGERG